MKTWRPGEDDEFDIAIDREWQKASREEPPLHVDAAILAAARTRRPRSATWQPLAAAAAVAGLAFLLVQLLPSERDLEQPGATAKTTMQGATEAAPVAPRVRENESQERDQRAPESATAAPYEPAEAAESRSDAALEPRQTSGESRADGTLALGAPAPTSAAEGPAGRSQSSSPAAPTGEMPPAKWATLIETLYASGDHTAAAEQLRAFRIEHEDADRYLPEAIREWASTVE